ncbi:MAG TPA: hypothetical protein PKE45_21035 [Caldilineaceae bacterium]|nr:hypothetical protein [Caldilineaceae bacterium]
MNGVGYVELTGYGENSGGYQRGPVKALHDNVFIRRTNTRQPV